MAEKVRTGEVLQSVSNQGRDREAVWTDDGNAMRNLFCFRSKLFEFLCRRDRW